MSISHQTESVENPNSKSVDHVIPLVKGGTDARANLRLTHLYCNKRKGDLDLAEFGIRAIDLKRGLAKAVLDVQKRRAKGVKGKSKRKKPKKPNPQSEKWLNG